MRYIVTGWHVPSEESQKDMCNQHPYQHIAFL